MKQILSRVMENRQLWPGVHMLTFDSAELAETLRPGHLALVRDPLTFDPYLRRSCWMYRADATAISFLLVTPGNEAFLARALVNSFLDILAPVGHPLELSSAIRHILLLGESDRALPLLAIASEAVRKGCAVVFSMQADSPEQYPPHFLFPPEVEYHTGGRVESLELFRWADQTIACGSEAFYHQILDQAREVNSSLEPSRVRILLDPAMPCGTGACRACAVLFNRRSRLACVDGPWFDLSDPWNGRLS